MSKKKKHKNIDRDKCFNKNKTGGTPILSRENVLAELSKPIDSSVHDKSIERNHIQIVNGVVSTTGRYSRLYEDYDDK